MNQNEISQVIKYQQKTFEYLSKWLEEEVERDKAELKSKVNSGLATDDEEAINAELEFDHNNEMAREENEL